MARDEDTTFSSGSLVVDRRGVRTTALTPLTQIPASDSLYVWRVRKVDANGNDGPWSLPARFRVTTSTMSALAPTAGSAVPPNGMVVQWSPVASAARYNVTLRPANGPTLSANTVATAWSPASFLSLGSYTWTATAYDANDRQLGSTSSSFTVDSRIMAVQAPEIQSPGGLGVGRTLTVRPPQWSVAGVDTAYQWIIGGQEPWTATGPTYTIMAGDYGKTISVRATGTKVGYLDGTSTSSPVTVTAGDAVNNVTRPTINGSPVVGSYLTANAGTWSGTGVSTTVQWMRDGVPIQGATGGLYQVVEADGGHELTIRVIATAAGYADGQASSEPVLIQTLRATSPVVISAPSGTGVGAELNATPPVWNQTDVVTSYMWLRDGVPLWSSTGATYTISPDDVGKAISVRATGKKPGFPDGTSTSSPVSGTSGAAPVALTAPTIKGTGAVGQFLSVDPGKWSVSFPTYSYAWLRNGSVIPDATGGTYAITATDAASQISVRVTVSSNGRADGVAVTAPVAVAQLVSTTSLSVLPTALTKGKRGKLTITVAASGLPAPTGTLVVKDGKKTLKKLTLTVKNKGIITFKLPKLKAGKHKLSVDLFRHSHGQAVDRQAEGDGGQVVGPAASQFACG